MYTKKKIHIYIYIYIYIYVQVARVPRLVTISSSSGSSCSRSGGNTCLKMLVPLPPRDIDPDQLTFVPFCWIEVWSWWGDGGGGAGRLIMGWWWLIIGEGAGGGGDGGRSGAIHQGGGWLIINAPTAFSHPPPNMIKLHNMYIKRHWNVLNYTKKYLNIELIFNMYVKWTWTHEPEHHMTCFTNVHAGRAQIHPSECRCQVQIAAIYSNFTWNTLTNMHCN